jgi:hypothetical protein
LFLPDKSKLSSIQSANSKTARNTRNVSKRMPVFTCECGATILIVPDVRAMNRAVKEHLPQHKKATGKYLTEDALTQKIIKTLSNTPLSKPF